MFLKTFMYKYQSKRLRNSGESAGFNRAEIHFRRYPTAYRSLFIHIYCYPITKVQSALG